jgi:exodeoxyribonuclease VII large subunit
LVIEDKFVHLDAEFTKIMDYKLSRLTSVLPQMQSNFRQAMVFIVEQKSQYVKYVEQKHLMNDPKLQCHKGWAQTSVEGQLVELSGLEINQKFILQDASTRIEALCLAKT